MGLEVKENSVIGDFQNAETKHRTLAQKTSLRLAQRAVKNINEGVLGRKFNLTPNKPSTLRGKVDDIPLVDTFEYIRKLKAVKTEEGAAIQGDLDLAKKLEFGVGGPHPSGPRPHIAPALSQLNEELDGLLGQEFLSELFSR
jgi:hypothetical protein